MAARTPWFAGFVGLVMLAIASLSGSPARGRPATTTPDDCAVMRPLATGTADAAPALQQCLDAAPAGGSVDIPPGSYLLASPITIRRAVRIATIGLAASAPPCRRVDPRCATLLPSMPQGAIAQAPMPIDIQADDVAIDHIIFAGSKARTPQVAHALCLSQHGRSLAGGIRFNGGRIRVTRSVFRDFACYSAFEFGTGSGTIADNLFVGNGTHDVYMMWSDGLTIHDGRSLEVRNNLFVDNTDVQLIFGGCDHCTVSGNRFRHSGSAGGGSFAELMIHAWPGGATTGRYDGTVFTDNDIDCGAAHRCGFGIMIGALPWYQAPTSGGSVTGNHVRNAMLGIDVDGLSGSITLGANDVIATPGRYPASCGSREIDRGVNIAPASRRFVANAAVAASASAASYANCLLNYPDFPKSAT